MADYHVDRMRVQAQQCVQLSITNHPFDLILLLSYSIYTYFLLYADISEPAAVKTAVRRTHLPLRREGGMTGPQDWLFLLKFS